MFVFWWTGKGYLGFIIPILILGGFGFVGERLGHSVVDSGIWWGCGFILSGLLLWRVGIKVNRRSIAKRKAEMLTDRLFYRAGNKFMSIPLETWSIPLVAIGLVGIVIGAMGMIAELF